MTADALAKFFHETYERLAPKFDYRTRRESATPWSDVPRKNKQLMVATCEEVLEKLKIKESMSAPKYGKVTIKPKKDYGKAKVIPDSSGKLRVGGKEVPKRDESLEAQAAEVVDQLIRATAG